MSNYSFSLQYSIWHTSEGEENEHVLSRSRSWNSKKWADPATLIFGSTNSWIFIQPSWNRFTWPPPPTPQDKLVQRHVAWQTTGEWSDLNRKCCQYPPPRRHAPAAPWPPRWHPTIIIIHCRVGQRCGGEPPFFWPEQYCLLCFMTFLTDRL